MLLKDVVSFNTELFFDGAVNVKWLYEDIDRFKKAANSFVFHNDDFVNNHNQTSTLGFLKILTNVISDDAGKMNNLIMGIAPYGSGKSHFLTSIYTLFSNNNSIIKNDQVLKNIAHYDEDFTVNYKKNVKKPNIVLLLNGMEDFDLSLEMEKQVRFILEKTNIDTNIFYSKDVIYEGMKSFLDVTYESRKFKEFLQKNSKSVKNVSKKFLIDNLSKDIEVFNFVNKASLYVLGREFKVIEYLNPKTILENMCNKLCGEGKPFDKVIILFDEIGRYIYWMSLYHSNNSTIQQLFEGIQLYSNKVTFISFSQKSLDSYYNDLPREKIDTITRYIDRFKSSKKYYLSNILELILARLIDIKIPEKIKNNNNCDYLTITSWIPDVENKHIWSSRDAYEYHVEDKLFIFHPLTIYSLVSLSEFTQKRSAINVLHSLMNKFENTDLRNFDTIRACDLFNTDIIDDIMSNDSFNNSAQDLLVKYKTVIKRAKNDISLKLFDIKILQAITLIRILSLKINSYQDYLNLIMHISATKNEDVVESLARMQDKLGIIVYSEEKYSHYIDENSSSKSDLLRYIKSKKEENRIDLASNTSFICSMIQKYGGDQLDNLPCKLKGSVRTREWYFTQTFVHCDSFTERYIIETKKKLLENKEIKYPRSNVYWIYFNQKAQHNYDWYIECIQRYHDELKLSSIPYYTFFIYDENFTLIEKGLELLALDNLSDSDSAKFSKYLPRVFNEISDSFVNEIISLKSCGWFINSNDYTRYTDYKRLLDEKIAGLYLSLIPIRYESMDNKTLTGIKDYLSIAMRFSTKSLDKNAIIRTLTPRLKQRFEIIFGEFGWDIFDDKGHMRNKFKEPLDKSLNMFNDYLHRHIYECIVYDLFEYFYAPPYGMNVYTFLFMIGIYFNLYSQDYIFKYNDKELLFHDWFPIACEDNKKIKKVLENSIIAKNKNLDLNNVIQDLINTTDVDEFLSIISNKKINNLKNMDLEKSSLINKKWQTVQELEKGLMDIQMYSEKLFKCELNFEFAEILKSLSDLTMLNSRFSKIDNDFKTYFNGYPQQINQLYVDSIKKISRKIEKILTNWNDISKEDSLPEIESKLNSIDLIEQKIEQCNLFEFSKALNLKKKSLQTIISTFNKYHRLIKSNGIVENIFKQSELLQHKDELQKLLTQIMLDKQLTTLLKSELVTNIDDMISIIHSKIETINSKIEDLIDNLPNKIITNLKSLLEFREQVYDLLAVIDSNHKFYAILNKIMNEIDTLNSDIKKIRNQEMTIEDISYQINVIKSKINIKLNVNQFLKNEKRLMQDEVLEKSKKYTEKISYFAKNKTLNMQDIIHLINEIDNRPVYLAKEDVIFVEKLKNELIASENELIGNQILKLFNKIKDNDYKESILEKLLNTLRY